MSIEKVPSKSNLFSLKKKDIILYANPEVNTIINKCNDEYLYWDKVKYQASEKLISADQLWSLLRFTRIINSKKIKFGKYDFTIFITDKMYSMLHKLDMEMGGNLQYLSQLSNAEKKSYILSSLQEEAIASSKMEGASTTRKIAKEMLRKEDTPKDINQTMILNNFKTMQFLVNQKDEKLTLELILKIHREITTNTLDKNENVGKLRDNNEIRVINSITGEIVHTPPNFVDLSSLLNELCDFCNNDQYFAIFIHPIIKSIIIHFMISFFHPFVDGNGRTARSLVYWYLLKNNYGLTEYISISRIIHKTKNKYEKSFLYTEYDRYDLSYFINYNLETLIKAKEELELYLDRKSKEKRDYNRFIGVDSITEREAQILNKFNKEPDRIVTIIEVQNFFSISNQTARSDLEKLVKLKYLEKVNLNNRKFGYKSGIKLIEG